jgi:hypothetical protein
LRKIHGEVLENLKKQVESGKRPDMEHRGFEGLAGLSSEEARETATTT